MSDERSRERERAARTGEPGAAAALLAEDLRAGRVTPEQVALAALVGWPAARPVLGRAAPPLPRTPSRGVLAWFRRLKAHDRWTLARALVAIARARRHATDRRYDGLLLALDGCIVERRSTAEILGREDVTTLAVGAALQATEGRVVHLELTLDDLRAVRDELGPWALGGPDPVAARWSARPPPPAPCDVDVDDSQHRAFLRSKGRMKDWSVFD